jgi:hypothetical protein
MSEQPVSDIPFLSIIIPMLNESGNVTPLLDEITVALCAYTPIDGARQNDPAEVLCEHFGITVAAAVAATKKILIH